MHKLSLILLNLLAFILIFCSRGYDTVDGRRIFGVVLPILKGRQLRIHCSVFFCVLFPQTEY